MCTSEGSLTWLPVLFAYKGFILLAGLFLAFETRKVKIKSLNDSRFIAMSVYGTVIVSVTLTPIGFLLQHFPNVQYAIIGIMILFSTSLILGLIFVTKVYIHTYIGFVKFITCCFTIHIVVQGISRSRGHT